MTTTHKPIPGFLKSLRAREDSMARLLGRFVRVESPSFDKSAVDQFGRVVASEWQRRGAIIKILRETKCGDHVRAELYFRKGPASGQILVLGHLDTVYDLGTIVRMPFRVARE